MYSNKNFMIRFLCFEDLQLQDAKGYVKAPRLGRPLTPFVIPANEEPPTKKARASVEEDLFSDEGELQQGKVTLFSFTAREKVISFKKPTWTRKIHQNFKKNSQ